MLTKLIEWSVGHPFAVVGAWLLVAALGVSSLFRLPMDAFPDTTPIQVQINTVSTALSPLEVERQLTFPVEQAISGLPGLSEVRSISKFGLSQVVAIFEDETDIYLARQLVSERLANVARADNVVGPALGPVATGLGEVFHYVVKGENKTLAELTTLQDWVIKPQLRSVPGVAEVNTWGGLKKQLHILVDPAVLERVDLTLSQVVEAVESNNENAGGGVIAQGGEAQLVRGLGAVESIRDVQQIVVNVKDGVPLLLGNIAEVVEGGEIRRGAVTHQGQGEVVLGLGFMLMGENSRDVTTGLRARLMEVNKILPEGVRAEVVYDRSELVETVLTTVKTNLFEGALFVIAILFLFLGNLRAGLIVASAIPLSMLVAFDFMLRAGVAGSLMSLGAIDFGLIVDSAVIQIENASKRLAEAPAEKPHDEIIRDAAVEVRRPTLFGELIILIVYLPVLTLTGIEGMMFRPMALTVVFALVASLLMSVTLMPALSRLFLRRSKSLRSPLAVRWLDSAYRPMLDRALRHPWAVLGFAMLIAGNGAFLATQLGSQFIPRLSEGAIAINTIRLASVSLDESVRYGTQIERALLNEFEDEVDKVWTRTGTAEVATDPMGVELSDVFVTLRPRDEWTLAATQEALVEAMQAHLAVLPGMRMVFTQPIEMRVNEMVAGIRADVGVKIFGDDLDELTSRGRDVERVLKSIPGASDVSVEQVTGLPLLEIDVDREAMARHGVQVRDVMTAVRAIGTLEVGEYFEGERRFPIALRLSPQYRNDTKTVGDILIGASNGARIPISRLAEVRTLSGPSTVQREWSKRRLVVQCNVRGRDVGSFVEEARIKIAEEVPLESGYFIRYGGQFEHLQSALRRLMVVVPFSILLVFILLFITYRRWLDALRVFTGVPFAAVGGVAALWLCDIPFSVSAAIGFIALCGVAVLGDMVLVSTIRQFLEAGRPLQEAVRDAALRRLRPVLMTASVASVGFLPMALNTGIGAEVQRPLATVVIGGMITATFLTLFVLPVLYIVVGRKRDSA
ncbi:MAG: efflux RND transporter permease subunit [Deltaproteobacteria bacterium]|nr:efflux RND transporter permease subunit [Deltaproteobacteria bacterium]